MIYLLLIIAPFIAYILSKLNHLNKDESVTSITLSLVAVVLFLAIMSVIPPREEQLDNYVIEIVQIKQSSTSDISGGGSFLGWSVSGGERAQYVIMEKFKDGKMKRRFLDQDCTYIVETDSQPRVEYYQTRNLYSKIRHFPTYWDKVVSQYYHRNAIIFVPTGTVAVAFDKL